jgi:hypothetical protein
MLLYQIEVILSDNPDPEEPMAFALQYDVPADEQMYRQVREALGDEQPKGLVVHLVVHIEGGLRHLGVWDTEEDWQRFRDERVQPAVHSILRAAGSSQLPPEPRVEELGLVDVWLGA